MYGVISLTHFSKFLSLFYFSVSCRIISKLRIMATKKVTANQLAEDLCELLNKSPVEKVTVMTDHFAKERKMVCTRVLLPTDPHNRRKIIKILQVWLDKHHFWLYFHEGEGPNGGTWKIQGDYTPRIGHPHGGGQGRQEEQGIH